MSTQLDFTGGMNLFDDSLLLGETQYALAFNVRNRNAGLSPIRKPLLDSTAPIGTKQGLYAFDKYLVLFNNGYAYYKDTTLTDGGWTKIEGLSLSATAEYIYVQPVPASVMNYSRKLKEEGNVQGNSTDNGIIKENIVINGTLAGLVVQDGVSQGWIIFSDGTARKLQTYEQWTNTAREYVPKMKQMCYINDKLYGISPDGKQIYSSVSGRPLDFVVNVTSAGLKGGNASTTAYAVGYNPATCLISLGGSKILVGTDDVCYPITLDYEKLIFAEPYYLNLEPFSAGVVNQFSFLKVVKAGGFVDNYFLAPDGLRTYLEVHNDLNEGRNEEFSVKISSALAAKQSVAASIIFDDYSFFSLKTIYSDTNYVAVYDNKRQKWVCFDRYAGLGSIRQFAVSSQATSPALWAITNNEVYKMFHGNEYETAEVYFKSNSSYDANIPTRLKTLNVVLLDGNTTGTITAYEIADGYSDRSITENIRNLKTENICFNFERISNQNFRSQIRLTWNTSAKLQLIQTTYSGTPQKSGNKNQVRQYAS